MRSVTRCWRFCMRLVFDCAFMSGSLARNLDSIRKTVRKEESKEKERASRGNSMQRHVSQGIPLVDGSCFCACIELVFSFSMKPRGWPAVRTRFNLAMPYFEFSHRTGPRLTMIITMSRAAPAAARCEDRGSRCEDCGSLVY